MTVQNASINIGSLGTLKPTTGLSMLKIHIIITTWIDAKKIKAFMIGLEKESLIRTGLIMKKEDICGRKASGA